MADIKYLNYGNQQVDEQALLTSMANDVQKYVNSKSWSKKRKEKFMNAYSDLIGRGLLGASNDTGQWYINVEKGPITYGDKKDEQMYGEAAYFIQQQMNRLATTPEVVEEAKPQEETQLTSYGDSFGKVFGDYIKRTYYGNQDFHIGGEKDDWNVLDSERDEYGRRGKSNRALKLAEYLENYKKSLTDNTYDFKDSPFNSLEDLRNKLDRAITSLRNENIDQEDIDSLNVLGLDARDWFNDGSGEDYVDEFGLKHPNPNTNKYYTYAEWYGLKNKESQEKEEVEDKKALEDSLKEVKAKMDAARKQAEETFNINQQINGKEILDENHPQRVQQYNNNIKKYKDYLSILEGTSKDISFSDAEIKEGIVDLGNGRTVKVSIERPRFGSTGDVFYKIEGPNFSGKFRNRPSKPKTWFGSITYPDLKAAKYNLMKLLHEYSTNREKNMLEFESLGWLKQGGKITNEQIDKFLQQWK